VTGSHDLADDERNQSLLVFVNGKIVPRRDAVVSVFDAVLILGDGIWESFRFGRGRVFFLAEHLDRLYQGLKAIHLDPGMSRDELTRAIYELTAANGMHDGVHIRVVVTRGEKTAASPDPRMSVGKPNVVIIAEYQMPHAAASRSGIVLATVSTRAPSPGSLDVRLNSSSRLPIVIASLEAAQAGADEALMLDPFGFIASCSSTNLFIVRGRELWTSTRAYCFPGITRRHVIELARDAGLSTFEQTFTLAEVYDADEAFVTGSMSGITSVSAVDGRAIGDGMPGPVTQRLRELYNSLLDSHHDS
jgi:branched-chain amino acid aminotransferase